MDLAVISAVVGVPIAIVAGSVGYFALDEGRRAEFIRFWKRWATILFVVVAVGNSAIGLYLFFRGPEQVYRRDVLTLLIHLFNLIAIPGVLFVTSLIRALEVRDTKRLELVETVKGLQARIDAGARSDAPTEPKP